MERDEFKTKNQDSRNKNKEQRTKNEERAFYILYANTYYLLPITYCSSFIIYVHYPSPDRNGYPTAGVGERRGLGDGGARREEYEWIAG